MITQRTKSVPVLLPDGATRDVVVRRLRWKAADAFYTSLFSLIGEVLTRLPAGKAVEPRELLALLPVLVTSSRPLLVQLVQGATGLAPSEIDDLDYGDVLQLLDTALEINLDADIKNSSAGIVEKVATFAGFQRLPKPSSGPVSTST